MDQETLFRNGQATRLMNAGATIEEAAALMRTDVEAIKDYLRKVGTAESRAEATRAKITAHANAFAEAERLDRERRREAERLDREKQRTEWALREALQERKMAAWRAAQDARRERGELPSNWDEQQAVWTKRNAEIAAKRASGMTLQAIGDAHGLSKERVRGIVAQEERKRLSAERRANLMAEVTAHREQLKVATEAVMSITPPVVLSTRDWARYAIAVLQPFCELRT